MKKSKAQKRNSCCPLTSKPRLRFATDAQTAEIKQNFPPGIAQPALRALVAAGFRYLDELTSITRGQLSELHGMGPSAVEKLAKALKDRGLAFLSENSSAAPSSAIDEYIQQFPQDVQVILKKIRAVARQAAPDATELISYRMPALKMKGILIYYAAFKSHIGLFPPVSGDAALLKAIAPYAGPKGNLKFPLSDPIPYKLIERIIKLRVRQQPTPRARQREGSAQPGEGHKTPT